MARGDQRSNAKRINILNTESNMITRVNNALASRLVEKDKAKYIPKKKMKALLKDKKKEDARRERLANVFGQPNRPTT